MEVQDSDESAEYRLNVAAHNSAPVDKIEPSDATLVAAARDGQGWAQEALFQRHCRMVNALAFRLMATEAAAEDLAQDSFIRAFSRLDSLDNPQAFAAWLGTIVVRLAHKRFRRERLLSRLGLDRGESVDLDSIVSRDAPPDVSVEVKTIYALVQKLKPEERTALLLRRVEGMTIPQIAETMGRSIATVKRRVEGAQRRLDAMTKRERPIAGGDAVGNERVD